MDLVAVARRAFLTSVRNDLLADAIVFDVAISVLSMKIFLHRSLHALDAMMFEVCESDDMTKHGAIRIDSGGIIFEINSAQISGEKFCPQRGRQRLRHFTLDHDVSALTIQFFRQLPSGNPQFTADKINNRLPIIKMSSVTYYSFDRHIVRENLVVRVEDRAAFCIDGLFVNVLFSSKPRVLVVLDYLKINKTKREGAKERDENAANQCTTASAMRVHLVAGSFTTG